MNKKKFNFIMLDVYLNHKTNMDKINMIDDEVIKYLEKLLSIYYDENYTDKIDKYSDMLDFAGNDSLSKIARDIRQCIINLQRQPYQEEYDESEKILIDDIVYIQNIINKFN